jgi:hypothetical protein
MFRYAGHDDRASSIGALLGDILTICLATYLMYGLFLST